MTWNSWESQVLLEVKVHGWNLEFQSNGIGWMGFKLFVQMMRSWFNKHIFLGEIVCLRLDMTFNNPEQVACWCSGMNRELAKDIFCQWNTIQYTRYIYMHIAYIITGYIQIFVSIYTWTYTDHQVLQDVFLWIIFHAVILLPNFSRWISLGFPLVFRWFLGSLGPGIPTPNTFDPCFQRFIGSRPQGLTWSPQKANEYP